MTNIVARTIQEKPQEHTVEVKSDPVPGVINDVEVPYTDNEKFLDDYFKIGSEWRDQDASFYPEVEKIDMYMRLKIRNGEMENSQKSVKEFLGKIEKLNDLKSETRSVVKLEVMANYVDFLMKNDHLKSNLKRYANTR